jgi:hypothetical protein
MGAIWRPAASSYLKWTLTKLKFKLMHVKVSNSDGAVAWTNTPK